jgi:hypothetical protein
MLPQYFTIISKTRALGLGEFPYPEWYKKEKENTLSNVGIKVEYGEPLYEGEYKVTFKTVSDKDYAEMIRLYVEKGLGINKIAEILGRSSRTPLVQIQRHSKALERNEFCLACRRVKSAFERESASKKSCSLGIADLNLNLTERSPRLLFSDSNFTYRL